MSSNIRTVCQAFAESLVEAAQYNQHDQAAPTVVLWPDKERLWEPLIPRLREALPILTLGPYDPANWTGPAIWIRCAVARTLSVLGLPDGTVPILYLPGVSKQELRAVDECPRHLQPLAELQYRGVLFTQRNGRDWTVAAFLQSADGGLQIPVASDAATREAMLRALLKLADEPLTSLRVEAPLTAAKFDALMNPEPVRDLLLWMNDSVGRRASYGKPEWDSFRSICKNQFSFDPEADGVITAATLLGKREGPWGTAWNRLAEAPAKYTAVPDLLRRARPSGATDLFFHPSSWPQDNESQEVTLRSALLKLGSLTTAQARDCVMQLEQTHGLRREWVWAELGFAPLATALRYLVRLADSADKPLAGATPNDVAQAYTLDGWKIDQSALQALAVPDAGEDVAAVCHAVDVLYRPWLTATAELFQQVVKNHPISGTHKSGPAEKPTAGACILFADGLRFDVARAVGDCLKNNGLSVSTEWRFSALPGVTSTAKPAVSPVGPLLMPGSEFGAAIYVDGTKVTVEQLRKELDKAGYQPLLGNDTGTPTGAAWTECGRLDSYGHEQGWRLALRIPEQVREIAERIAALLHAGWREVRVVTDHGWLLLPNSLPKIDLPEHLTEARKGRCARLKPASHVTHQTVPWYWDKEVAIAVAPGIGCYVAGKEYEHGGLSPQECVVPVMTVTASKPTIMYTRISDVRWNGLRCRISVTSAGGGMTADLRLKAGDAATSIAAAARPLDGDGRASLTVPDDSKDGDPAIVVVLDSGGHIVAQRATIIGEVR